MVPSQGRVRGLTSPSLRHSACKMLPVLGLSKKDVFRPATNRRKLCFRLHHSRRSHEEKCNRLHPVKLAESPIPYGAQAFSPLRPHHECNQKNKPFTLRKLRRPPTAIGFGHLKHRQEWSAACAMFLHFFAKLCTK